MIFFFWALKGSGFQELVWALKGATKGWHLLLSAMHLAIQPLVCLSY